MTARRAKVTAKRSDERLWKQVVAKVMAGTKGGRANQWSARKAQLAVRLYKKRGGGYLGERTPRNSLVKWTREQWRTKSGQPSLKTGERYLPAQAIRSLSPAEYGATTKAKRLGMKQGKQFVRQPRNIARKVSRYRKNSRPSFYRRVLVVAAVGISAAMLWRSFSRK